ncbi:S8 family serine peptidase [bacterium]|nr:S8 family serine peptidase [bacterium]
MAEEAQSITLGEMSVGIAILDTGIPYDDLADELTHSDLDNSLRIILGEICFDSSTSNPEVWNDVHGHGTHVSGIALAARNEYGIVGVCPSCTGRIEKIMHQSNTSLVSAILRGIEDSQGNAEILNLSYGFFVVSDILTGAIDWAASEFGMLFVFSCGNDGQEGCRFPASLAATRTHVIAVAGTDPADQRWKFLRDPGVPLCEGSNFGSDVTVAAPAGSFSDCDEIDCMGVLSDLRDGIALEDTSICGVEPEERVMYASGTSMAAPAVAGIAGLLLSFDNTLSYSELREIIEESADNVYGTTLPNDSIGYGRVNAFKALLRAPGVKTLSSDLHVRKHIYDSVSPYYLESGLIVPDSVTLTLDPGVHITMGPNAYILVNGSLVANGTSNNVIHIEAANTGERWNGLTINGGSVEMSYVNLEDFKDHGLYVESPDAVSISHVDLDCSSLKYQGIGLRLWNSPTVTQSVSDLIVHDVPADSQIAGMYLYNCKVGFNVVTIEDCDWINSYIKKVTGTFRECSFQDRTETYGVLFNSTPNTPNFRCCNFQDLGPTSSSWPSSIFCATGTSPSFGGEGDTGGDGVSNVITDSCAYLMIMQGTLALPVVDSDPPVPPQYGSSNGGKNNWKNVQASGKYFQWQNPGTTTYPCTDQWWAGGVDTTMFSPSVAARWDFDPEASSEWGLCGGGSGGGGGSSVSNGPLARNAGGTLDDGEYDDVLRTAFEYEETEDYAAAQQLFRSVAENSTIASQQWTALAHVVVCEAFVSNGQSWIPGLLTDLIEEQDSYEAGVQGERLRVSYYQNRGEYDNAIETCVSLLNSGLTYEDSIYVAMDLMGLQMNNGDDGGSLDGMSASQLIPATLRARDNEEALGIERGLFEYLMSGGRSNDRLVSVPQEYKLYQNYPNPFNPTTQIEFDLPEASNLTLKVFNTLGQEVVTVSDGKFNAGHYVMTWNGKSNAGIDVATGLYIYQLKAGSFLDTKKMILMR